MTNAVTLLDQLQEAGVKATIDGSDLFLVPADRVPAEMIPALKEHKADIMTLLRPKSYRQRFDGEGPGESELAEIEKRVRTKGVCLTWCEALEDFVAFVRDDIDHGTVPPGFVIYTEAELAYICDLSADGLRRVHGAKRTGAVITGSEPLEEAT